VNHAVNDRLVRPGLQEYFRMKGEKASGLLSNMHYCICTFGI